MLRTAVLITLVSASPVYAQANNSSSSVPAQFRQMICAATNAEDITARGRITHNDKARDVVVCASKANLSVHQRKAATRRNVRLRSAAQFPFSQLDIDLQPTTGTYAINDDPEIPLSCSARIHNGYNYSVSGESDIRCRAYVTGGTAAGCSASWTGNTRVPSGNDPYYMKTVTLHYNCVATSRGTFGTAIDYRYDGSFPFYGQDTASITVR